MSILCTFITAKVMFLQVSVCPRGCMHGRGACVAGGMHGRGGCAWQGGMAGRAVYMAGGVCGRGACVADTTRYGQ